MKSKIILGLATLATLAGMAAPAMADDGYRFRDRDHDRVTVNQRYRNDYRYEAREARERRERIERERREWREHHRGYYGYYR